MRKKIAQTSVITESIMDHFKLYNTFLLLSWENNSSNFPLVSQGLNEMNE